MAAAEFVAVPTVASQQLLQGRVAALENALASLQTRVAELEQENTRLREVQRCIFTVSSDGAKGTTGRIAWNSPTLHMPAVNDELIVVMPDHEHILVAPAGVYKVEAQILPSRSHPVNMLLEVNDTLVMAGYGATTDGYSAANMSVLLRLGTNSRISVNFQPGCATIYTNPDGKFYHNLVIMRIA